VNARDLATLVAVASAASPELRDGVHHAIGSTQQLLRHRAAGNPAEALAATVLASALVFYHAERGANPQVGAYEDALVFAAACLSGGYTNVAARTPVGKALAAWLMSAKPALAQPASAEPP
jgi:hypothetical protein